MNTAPLTKEAVSEPDLLQLQLRIARRADELARRRAADGSGNNDRDCWLDAEREVLDRVAEPALL